MKLTQKAVDGIGLEEDRVVWDDDAPGLGLRVQSGKRSWIVRYRVGGVQRQKSLDGHLKLAKARAEAAEIRTSAKRGADIIAEGRAQAEATRREAEAAKARSLGAIVEKYLVDAEKRLRPASFKVARLYLTGARYWQQLHHRPGRRPGPARDPGGAGALERQGHRRADARPSERVPDLGRRAQPARAQLRHRHQAAGARRSPASACSPTPRCGSSGPRTAGDDGRTYAKILRLLLLTGQRRGEVGGMRRAELDFDRDIWSLPGARTKNKLPHDVPLSRQVKAILEHAGRRPPVRQGRLHGTGGGPRSSSTRVEPAGVDRARPAPHRGHRHGRDRHRAAHRRGRGQPRKRTQRWRGRRLQ